MARSLRGRLQVWYGLVLASALAGFALFLYLAVSGARNREIDADLLASAAYLDAALRAFPASELASPSPRLLADLEVLPRRPGPPRPEDRWLTVWRADGGVVKTTGADPGEPPDVGERPRILRRPGLREAGRRGPSGTVIVVSQLTAHVERDLALFAGLLAGAGAAVLLIALLGGAAVSARVLRPLDDIAGTASRISADNLSERIDVSRTDAELTALARVLNATFDRLQAAFDRQARFTADASHELRTPLAVIRSQAELMLLRPREAGEYREALTQCVRASRRMAAVVDDLLMLARADASRLELRREPVRLDRVVCEAAALVEPLAREKGVAVEVKAAPMVVTGDAEALARVAGTLLSNAVAYNRDGGRVWVSVGREGGEAVLRVEDTGVGIGAEHLPRLFERFYRVDPSRSGGGTGLGLAICRAMAEAHGGRVEVTSEPGVGTVFTVRLPLGEPTA